MTVTTVRTRQELGDKFMGGTIYVLANVYNWRVQHNVLHPYTNIPGHDELDAGRIIRFTKMLNGITFHRFQQYYSVFLYGLLIFNWAILPISNR
jgi:linoleoyl-CoA desaturase